MLHHRSPPLLQFARAVAAAIAGATGLASNEVWVVFEEVNARDWYVGETDVETRRAAR